MEKIVIQQGDCILISVSEIPQSALKVKFNGIVLKGEGSNTHEMKTDTVKMYEDNGIMYLRVKKETPLIHQEHGTQTVKPGIYRRIIEREFDYETEESRNVRD